jgi:hypothetical protein
MQAAGDLGVPRVVYASSEMATGLLTEGTAPTQIPFDETEWHPSPNAYALSKYISEVIADSVAVRYPQTACHRASLGPRAALAAEDALVLTELLAARDDWAAVGGEFERRRRPRVKHVQKMTDRQPLLLLQAGLSGRGRAPCAGPRAS